MKDRSIVSSLVSGAVALLILGGHAKQQQAAAVDVNAGPAGNEWTKVMADQEEHKTYQLAAGAHVDVSNISGPVSVEATDGSTAEVSIYRTAPNPDDLAYRKVSVEQTSSGLTIQQKNDGTEHSSIDLLNRVVLKLPRQVSVSGKSIGGDFNISGVLGAVDLNSISGSVDARHLNGALSVAGVSGSVRVAVERINHAGLRVSNVSGSIYLRLASDLNADLSISNTSGGVSNKIESLVLDKSGASGYSARLGTGGPRIVVSNLTGAVVLSPIKKDVQKKKE
jgi:Putative adhesin